VLIQGSKRITTFPHLRNCGLADISIRVLLYWPLTVGDHTVIASPQEVVDVRNADERDLAAIAKEDNVVVANLKVERVETEFPACRECASEHQLCAPCHVDGDAGILGKISDQ